MHEASEVTHAIEVCNLTKRFGRALALDNLTFEVPVGVICGFVGPNGSGKTTTMRILTTLLKQDSGFANVLGMGTGNPLHGETVRHAIGFMPDYFGLYTDMTAGEYLDFFGAAYRIPADKRGVLVSDILALVSLTEKKDALISGLSRGMQQKLTLGRCLIHSPRLLLLDEPASGLDPRARIELMELLRELRTMGKTIFISSHILSELHNLCDMVVIIQEGRTVYTGGVAEASARLMAGRNALEMTVATNVDAAVEVLNAVNGVTGIRRRQKVLVVEHTSQVSSADIIAACVTRGVMIEDARKECANLEDIFMRLTKED